MCIPLERGGTPRAAQRTLRVRPELRQPRPRNCAAMTVTHTRVRCWWLTPCVPEQHGTPAVTRAAMLSPRWQLIYVTFRCSRDTWRSASLLFGAGVGRAVASNQGVFGHSRAPGYATGFGLKVVLMAGPGLQEKRHGLLAPMRAAAPLIGHAQAMKSWRDSDVLYVHQPIERLRIKPKEMDSAWQDDAGIGL